MPLTTDDILRAVGTYSGGAGARGFANAHLRAYRQRQRDYPRAQYAFLTDLAATPTRPPQSKAIHPAEIARRGTEGRAAGSGPRGAALRGAAERADDLTAAELMWLQRLPTDPAQISFEDAVRLARMVDSVKPGTPSGMLLASIWEPLELLHTERVVKDQIKHLPGPARVNDLALGALAEAVAAVHPDLLDVEARGRARRLADDFEAEQERQHDTRKAELDAELRRVTDRRAARTQTTADTTVGATRS